MISFRRLFAGALALSVIVGPAPSNAQDRTEAWSASWASAQMLADGDNAPPALSEDVTLRQVVRLSGGGERLRVRISNRYGHETLRLEGASLARSIGPGRSGIVAQSVQDITFGGEPRVSVPPGADYVSDAVALVVPGGADIAISLHLAALPSHPTGHPGSRATSFLATGDQADATDLEAAVPLTHWYIIAAVDVEASAPAVIAFLGDSITDGYGVQPDTNQRWTDRLADRLRAAPGLENAAVLNLGIGGNRVLQDGLGPNAMARLDRDVLSQAGLTHLVILQGVNDLGVLTRDGPATTQAHADIVREMIGAYRQMVSRARASGVKAIGATIMPFAGSAYYHPGLETEADRQAVNAWIRAPGNFDAVIDFDAITRDPIRPDRLRPEVDGGDGLHPSIEGYRLMADAVPLGLFEEPDR